MLSSAAGSIAHQLYERKTAFGDTLEIVFTPNCPEKTFRVVVNRQHEIPCISYAEAKELYDLLKGEA